MDPTLDHIEQQKQARHELERDFGSPETSGSLQCPECESQKDRDYGPGFYCTCNNCKHAWKEGA